MSFANHEKAQYWSKQLNGNVTPRLAKSTGKYYFDCPDCKHTFKKELRDIVNKNSWCPFCKGTNKELCDNNDCKMCFEKSFASHPRAEFWSNMNDSVPRKVFINARGKYFFDCKECGHTFETLMQSVTGKKNTWCSYCSEPPKLLCNDDCDKCHNKSFASHSRSSFWNYKLNKCNPRQVFKQSNDKFHFICENNHEFQNNLNHVVFSNRWCSQCVNKTEALLLKWFNDNTYNVKYQTRYDWLKTRIFDYELIDYKVIVELDGIFHIKQVSNWTNVEQVKKIDAEKNELALKNGFHMIRISQEDVWNNIASWELKLRECIDNTRNNNPMIQYIGEMYSN